MILRNTFLIAAAGLFFTACSPTVQVNNFDSIKKQHKMIAILPADARFTVSEAERIQLGDARIKESEQQLAFTIQAEENKYFRKNNKHYTVAIQDIKKTNELLFASGRSFEEFRSMQQDSVAKLLGVDAVVFCNTSLSKKMSDGAYATKEVATALLLPIPFAAMSGSQYKVVMQVGLVDKYYPTIIWNTTYNPTGNREEDIFGIMKRTLRRSAETFPYNK